MYPQFFFSVLFVLITFQANAQFIDGTVADQDGTPLENTHIQVKGQDLTTVSDSEGKFRLPISKLEKQNVVLIVSRIGYNTKSVDVDVEKAQDQSLTIALVKAVYESENIVVTATRTRRDIEEVGIPVSVVSDEEISRSGSMRLSDVLSEQTGMQIVNDHGTGIQVQGFDPDYTRIMIDGNPVIGRTAGTLDLSRISVRNVKQIEIVKGPSSALWGSDALAGVINVITQQSNDPFAAGLTTRYGTNSTLDLNGNVSYNTDSWNNNFSLNRNSSGGYSLNPESVSQTVPEYENYTFRYRTSLDLNDQLALEANVRYFNEMQQNQSSITEENGSARRLNSDQFREDFMATPSISYTPFDRLNIDLSWMSSFYKTDSELTFAGTGERYEQSVFNQYYNKPELQAGYRWDNKHHSILGAGFIFEELEAERYPSQPGFTTTFLFTQHSWTPGSNFELTGGLRFDGHSEYSSQISPKISSRYRPAEWIQFRASAGRGFKAPEFRQLFLDFTNATAGYSVYGSSTVVEGIQRQKEEGNISQILIPIEDLEEIKAESSWAVNFGFDVDPVEQVRVRFNLFHNDVSDLIETAPIAQKTNGQSVYTYFNLDEVYTQGAEVELRYQFRDNLTGSIGYQLLDARQRIERERTVQDDQGEVVQRTDVSYEPMFNRSRHSGNVKLFYDHKSGWGFNIRGTLRGQYGLYDSNGNGFVDSNEYEPGYTTWDLAVSREIVNKITFQAGADNILDYTDSNQSSLSGRLWYGQVAVDF
ncbi:colicin I receptor [Aliifodinibius salipaludis]|uniref:Colicin I receptor n=1 Tax=Fodinibius salipaludis TaxID=2032627 RepID=A0A2A2GDC2_9BACT|nr:TonB-dependent receptor [Aliifodinibius salipaludis]PAU94984.1 colicin I receptor [Aliifodinibius salipaludis]